MTLLTPAGDDSRPNPQKRNILIQRLSRAPWWLLALVLFIVVVYFNNADDPTYQRIWREVQKGIETTLRVTFFAYGASVIIALLIAVMRRKSNSVLYNLFIYQPATLYVEFIRGIPTLVLVYFFALSFIPLVNDPAYDAIQWMKANDVPFHEQILGEYAEMNERTFLRSFARALPLIYLAGIALTISYSAFISEIFRAGLESIEAGQREAAQSLGMNPRQTFFLIILPQAFRNILPPLVNDFIAMLKESSLVSAVGVQDITLQGRQFAVSQFLILEAYNVIALTYLTMTLSLSLVVRLLENYLNWGRKER